MCPHEIDVFAEDLINSGHEGTIIIATDNKPNSMTESDFNHLKKELVRRKSKIEIIYQTKT